MVRIAYARGEKIGNHTYLDEAEEKMVGGRLRRQALMQCSFCGNGFTGVIEHAKYGTSSCGCRRQEALEVLRLSSVTHGMSKRNEYRIWKDIRNRCFNPNRACYKDYMARGITMCSGWRFSFQSFFDDLGPRPSKKFSVDRINNNAHYSCGHCEQCIKNSWAMNCRWATRNEQAVNKRNTKLVWYKGECKPLIEFCNGDRNLYKRAFDRIVYKDWSVKDAIERPPDTYNPPQPSNFIPHSFGVTMN